MAVKSIQKWQAADGKEFEDRSEAIAHDSLHRALSKVKGILTSPNISQGNPCNLALDLVNKPEVAKALRDALNKTLEHHRLYGKLRKEIA